MIFAAHSLPVAMAEKSPYERQLRETGRLAMEELERVEGGGRAEGWELAFQSRSGRPAEAWLEPEVRDCVRRLHGGGGVKDVVIVPIGFLAENLEVVYDLDVEVGRLCIKLGINMVRRAVVGTHPRLVSMIHELIMERMDPSAPRLALGSEGPWPDECPMGCCEALRT